jgi:hypothetical protein
MRINVIDLPGFSQPTVGNVYAIGGGYGRKAGHAMVLMAITKTNIALMLVIDREGEPTGVTSYGLHAIEERVPIAFVSGLEEMSFQMEPIR